MTLLWGLTRGWAWAVCGHSYTCGSEAAGKQGSGASNAVLCAEAPWRLDARRVNASLEPRKVQDVGPRTHRSGRE